MLIEYRRNIIFCRVRSADLLPLTSGVCHTRLDSGADDGEFQFCEDCRHLDKGLAHGVYIAGSAVYGDASEDFQSHMLLLNHVDDFAELLGRTAQTRDFTAYDPFPRSISRRRPCCFFRPSGLYRLPADTA